MTLFQAITAYLILGLIYTCVELAIDKTGREYIVKECNLPGILFATVVVILVWPIPLALVLWDQLQRKS